MMRFLRIRIQNYRGVQDKSIHFSPCGVTTVVGNNEEGKSSIAEAIRTIIEFPASSTAAVIKKLQPVGCDVGPEIELEMSCGPYRLLYTKRYLVKKFTTLRIEAPVLEQLSGNEAHDRVLAILHEHCDMTLFRALCMVQGESMSQAALHNSASLTMALNKAAGLASTEGDESALIDASRREYELYYSKKRGEPTGELALLKKELGEAQADYIELKARFEDVLADTEQVAFLEKSLAQSEKQIQAATLKHSESQKAWESLAVQKLEVERLYQDLLMMRESARSPALLWQARQDLIKTAQAAALQQHEAESACSAGYLLLQNSGAEYEAAWHDLEHKNAAFLSAKAAREHLEELGRWFERRAELGRLRRDIEQAENLRKSMAEDESILSAVKVNKELLTKLRTSEQELALAGLRQKDATPSVSIYAHKAISGHWSLDGEDARFLDLEAEGEICLSVNNRASLSFDGLLSIAIKAGHNANDLQQAVQKARQVFTDLCSKAEVTSLEEAEESWAEAQVLQQTLAHKKESLRNLLGPQSFEAWRAELWQRQSELEANGSMLDKIPPIDPEELKSQLIAAKLTLESADQTCRAAKSFAESQNKTRENLAKDFSAVQALAQASGAYAEKAAQQLAQARAAACDQQLAEEAERLTQAIGAAALRYEEAKRTFEQSQPEVIHTRLTEAKAQVTLLQRFHQDKQHQYTALTTKLATLGSQGLYDKLLEQERKVKQLERQYASLLRRAEAARLLYQTLVSCREKLQQAYLKPLQSKIEEFGGFLYDAGFSIELNKDLQILRRTRGGVTVPFESLSGGAKEQLSILARLACSSLAANDGLGVPLIFDDILSYTDPERLGAMGAVLELAGKKGQVIFLTCDPVRAAAISESTTVFFDRQANAGEDSRAKLVT